MLAVLPQVFLLNPYNEELYKKLFVLFGDKDELVKSEQPALEAKKKFELALKSNAIDDTESTSKNLKAIENRLQDYDVQDRTVEGEFSPCAWRPITSERPLMNLNVLLTKACTKNQKNTPVGLWKT